MSRKKIDKPARNFIQEVLDCYHTLQDDKSEFETELKKESQRALTFMEGIIPWSPLYSFQHPTIVAAFLECIGWLDRVIAAGNAENNQEEGKKIFSALFADELDVETQFRLDSLEGQDLSMFLALLFAMQGNMEGIQKYGQTVSELIEQAPGDQESLLKAVAVDRSVLAYPTIAREISLAHLKNDNSFMQKLAKSITQTKPRRRHDLDDFRFMVEVIDEVMGVRSVTYAVLTEYLVNDLKVYPERVGGDADAAIPKYLQSRSYLGTK